MDSIRANKKEEHIKSSCPLTLGATRQMASFRAVAFLLFASPYFSYDPSFNRHFLNHLFLLIVNTKEQRQNFLVLYRFLIFVQVELKKLY